MSGVAAGKPPDGPMEFSFSESLPRCLGQRAAAGLPPCAVGPQLRSQGWRLIACCWHLWPGSVSSGHLRPILPRNCSPRRQKNPVDLWDPGKESPKELNYSQEWIPPSWDGILTPSSFFLLAVVVQSLSCVRFCDPMDCSTPGFSVLHHLPECAQVHGHWVGDVIQPSHPWQPLLLLPSPCCPAKGQ